MKTLKIYIYEQLNLNNIDSDKLIKFIDEYLSKNSGPEVLYYYNIDEPAIYNYKLGKFDNHDIILQIFIDLVKEEGEVRFAEGEWESFKIYVDNVYYDQYDLSDKNAREQFEQNWEPELEKVSKSKYNNLLGIDKSSIKNKKESVQLEIKKLLEERGKDADLNDIDISGITDMSSLFKDLDPHNIDISKWDVSKVKNMQYMFSGCTNFNSDLSKWNVSNVNTMYGMFQNSNFNQDISEWNVSNVTSMGRMFYGCKNFNSDLSKWDVSHVEDMYAMFENCSKFNSDLSSWDVSNVEDMRYMFKDCSKFNCDLNKWNVDKANKSASTGGKYTNGMFDYCKSLENTPSWYK